MNTSPPTLARLTHIVLRSLWRPIPQRKLREALDRYLVQTALERLQIPKDEIGEWESVLAGRNTVVYRWQPVGRPPLFVRAWRYDRLNRLAREHSITADLFTQAGVAVPGVLLYDDSLDTLRRYRIEISIERAAPGRPLLEWLESEAAAPADWPEVLGADLACLHGWRGPAWGKPWRPRNKMSNPRQYWLGRIEKLNRRLQGTTCRLDQAQVQRGLHRLRAETENLALDWPALVHGDLSPAHVFCRREPGDAATRLSWIDLETVHFGHPAEDLAMVRGWADSADFDRVLAAWQADTDAPPPDLERALDYFERLRLFEKVSSRVVKRSHRPDRITAERAERLAAEQADAERRLAGLLQRA